MKVFIDYERWGGVVTSDERNCRENNTWKEVCLLSIQKGWESSYKILGQRRRSRFFEENSR